MRAALPQISERRGQLVLDRLDPLLRERLPAAAPTRSSKAGVEALGRALRTELAPFGASATVAYFGWVETELVRDSLDRQEAGQLAARRRRRGSC